MRDPFKATHEIVITTTDTSTKIPVRRWRPDDAEHDIEPTPLYTEKEWKACDEETGMLAPEWDLAYGNLRQYEGTPIADRAALVPLNVHKVVVEIEVAVDDEGIAGDAVAAVNDELDNGTFRDDILINDHVDAIRVINATAAREYEYAIAEKIAAWIASDLQNHSVMDQPAVETVIAQIRRGAWRTPEGV